MNKICSKCKLEKNLNSVNYEPRKNTKDGFRNQCRDCRNQVKKERYVYSDKIWTEQEKEILAKYYPFMSAKEISDKFLPNRNHEQITDHATKRLNLKKDDSFHKSWTQEQIGYLVDNYSDFNISVEDISQEIGKSNSTVTAMANSLGLFKDELFTNEEKSIVKKFYPIMKTINLQEKYLPNKTVPQITKFANENNIFKTSELRNEIRIDNAINNLKMVNGKKEPTKPELYIIDLLNKLDVHNIFQDFKKYYWVDFYLPEKQLIIEVQGDYFHCNPLMNLNYKVLNKNKIIAKDKRKHSYFKNKNINVLYLWESDIIKANELCKMLIENYINNNGNLENYHSFNYSLSNGELKLNDNLIAIGY